MISNDEEISDLKKKAWYCPNGCARKYLSKGNLNRHLTYECGVPKKFVCNLCGRPFARKHHLKSHMVIKHKIIPRERDRASFTYLWNRGVPAQRNEERLTVVFSIIRMKTNASGGDLHPFGCTFFDYNNSKVIRVCFIDQIWDEPFAAGSRRNCYMDKVKNLLKFTIITYILLFSTQCTSIKYYIQNLTIVVL